MPLYEYQCEACNHRFERIQKFSDPLVDICPACGKGPVRKLISSPAIQFKGSGWYITDYAKKEHTAAAKADGQGQSDSTEKTAKADTAEKADKSEKGDKTSSSSSSSDSSSSSASTESPSSSSKKE